MTRQNPSLVLVLLVASAWTASLTAADAAPTYDEARRASWMLTSELLTMLEAGDAKQCPGTHAWLKDLREQTKGIGKDTPVAKWPKVDIGALVDHNPNFWRMYYEIAPGDPALTLIHAGVLLSQGEAMRAAYLLEIGKHRPGIPKEARQAFAAAQKYSAWPRLKATNELTEEGTRLFDQGEYDKAIAKYREALKLCPQNGWTSYELGYTLRTQGQVARGEPLGKPGTVKFNGNLKDSPELTAAFAEARRHDPLQIMAFQGSNPDVIKAFMVMAKKVSPAWKTLQEKELTKAEEFHALTELSEGFQEAGVYDLALLSRQVMVARRNGYDPSDYPIIEASLRKLAPGGKIEDILTRLRGDKAKFLEFRPLMAQEKEDGQPELGSGERLYLPDKPAPKSKRINRCMRISSG